MEPDQLHEVDWIIIHTPEGDLTNASFIVEEPGYIVH